MTSLKQRISSPTCRPLRASSPIKLSMLHLFSNPFEHWVPKPSFHPVLIEKRPAVTISIITKVKISSSVFLTFSSHAFGFLHISKQPEAAVAVLNNDVLPFYKKLRLPGGAVLTDNGREFCGTENHPFELYLDLNDITHRRTRVKRPQTNGFVERFHRTALDEFYRGALREKVDLSVEALHEDLDHWLRHYNR